MISCRANWSSVDQNKKGSRVANVTSLPNAAPNRKLAVKRLFVKFSYI